MNVRCKFRVSKVAECEGFCYRDNKATEKAPQEVTMHAVYGGSKENQSFAAATPNGTLTFYVNNPDVSGAFKPGQEYYLDLIPASE